jgi:hypothetical protein
MSPPMPQYQAGGGPPPPKRHQSGPPGQNDSPVPSQARPTQPPSQYHFYQPSNNSQFQVPYHHGPQVSHTPYQGSPPILQSSTSAGSAGSPRSGTTPMDARKLNGFSTPSPVPAPPPIGSIDTRPPPPSNAPMYDTRPPPPTTGFTSVNAGQASGFATVNTRVPPHATTTPSKAAKEHGTPKSEGSRRGSGKSPKSTTPITVGGLSLNKRTPSTTHPYQMSEAFANRHHHCEREDELKRGVWTSYGPMGSRDVPTGPPVEMYLRCNHDDCKRIDWKTVHGLQCHIVKSHEQPKGTIGSLEKALAIYGVPVREIQEYEKEHGLGTAGQMAAPKNQKIQKAMQKSQSPGSGDASTPSVTPSASYTSNGTPLGGPLFPPTPSKAQDAIIGRPPLDRDSLGNGTQAKPNSSFTALRNTWQPYEPPQTISAKDKGTFVKPPTTASIPSPSIPSQTSLAPRETPEKMPPMANAISAMGPATAAAVEISRAQPKTEETVSPVAQATPPLAAGIESTATVPVSSEPPTQVPKDEPRTHDEAKADEPAKAQPEVQPLPEVQSQLETQAQPDSQPEPTKESNTSQPKAEPESTTQHANPQPPATPARRPSRRESVSQTGAAMPSPKMSNKRAGPGRRSSAAATVSANASVDGGSGDEGEQKERPGTRRNATGRFLRKGR